MSRDSEVASGDGQPRPHLVIVNAVYPPEPNVSAQMGRDIAEHMADSGWKITVLCPQPSRPIGTDYQSLQNRSEAIYRREGSVDVFRLPSYRSPKSKLASRFRESWSFGRHVCRFLDGPRAADVSAVYMNTWPVWGPLLITGRCRRCGIPALLHVQDLYPESILGRVPAGVREVLAPLGRAVDRRTARLASVLLVPSPTMATTYERTRGVPPSRLTVLRNWQDERVFSSSPSREEARQAHGVPSDLFTFMYLGNIGAVAGVELLIHAYHRAGLEGAQLLIVGDGSARASCEALAKRLATAHIRFIQDPDVKNVPRLQAMADVCLLPVKAGAAMTSVPSKLIAYMLSGKPILATVDPESDTATCIAQADCGFIGPPEDEVWLADKMTEVMAMPDEALASLGANGRAFAMTEFSREAGVRKLGGLISNAKPPSGP